MLIYLIKNVTLCILFSTIQIFTGTTYLRRMIILSQKLYYKEWLISHWGSCGSIVWLSWYKSFIETVWLSWF